MGVYLLLDFAPGLIDPVDWADAYDEVVALFRRHPSGLMGISWREIAGVRRAVYTRDFERGSPGGADRRLYVVGDLASRRHSEGMELWRDIDHYRSRPGRTDEREDIVFLLSDSEDGESGAVVRVGEKTQGEPFHIPMLAAAMVLENRLPLAVAVAGDIDLVQAKVAKSWAEEVLGRKIELPVRLDAARLWDRLAAGSDARDLRVRFWRVFLGHERDAVAALCAHLPASARERWFLGELCDRAAEDGSLVVLAADWLDGGGELDRLCALACVHEKGAQIDPLRLADILADTGRILDPHAPPVSRSWRLLDYLMSETRPSRCHTLGELEQALARVFPERAAELMNRVCGKMRGVEASSVQEGAPVPDVPETAAPLDFEDLLCFAPGQLLPAEVRASLAAHAGGLAHALRAGVATAFSRTDFANVIANTGTVRTEDAWAWILAETDEAVLALLWIFATATDGRLHFQQLRSAVLENRALCHEIARISQGL